MAKELAGHTHTVVTSGVKTTVTIFKPGGQVLETKVAYAPWMAYRLKKRALILGSTLT